MYLDLFDTSQFHFNISLISNELVLKESPHATQKSCTRFCLGGRGGGGLLQFHVAFDKFQY